MNYGPSESFPLRDLPQNLPHFPRNASNVNKRTLKKLVPNNNGPEKKWFTDGNISIKNTRMNNNLNLDFLSPFNLHFKVVFFFLKKKNKNKINTKPLTRSSDRTHLWNRSNSPAPARFTAALHFGEPTRKFLCTAAIH